MARASKGSDQKPKGQARGEENKKEKTTAKNLVSTQKRSRETKILGKKKARKRGEEGKRYKSLEKGN